MHACCLCITVRTGEMALATKAGTKFTGWNSTCTAVSLSLVNITLWEIFRGKQRVFYQIAVFYL